MNPTHDPAQAEMIGFELTHAAFRHELPLLVAAFARTPSSPLDELTDEHLRPVGEHLIWLA